MKPNTIEGFMSIVRSVTPNNCGCLVWPNRATRNGYGAYKLKSKQYVTHRLVWQVHHGAIPKGLCVMHSCDVRRCVNIEHLSLGTWAENNRDRMRKGRSAVGEKSGRVKLSERSVRDIRRLYARGDTTCDKLGTKFGVSNHQISRVVTHKSWSHII